MSALEVGSAFLMGLMGSIHCTTMCGPIAAVVCKGDRRQGLWPHVGRLGSYMVLGSLAGVAGLAVQRIVPLALVQLGARVAAALLLIAVGFYAAGFFRSWAALERVTSPVFRRVSSLLSARAKSSTFARLAQGALWGLLPCGLVYGALGLAALAGSPQGGARVMLAFGAGTLPALIVVSLFADGFTRLVKRASVRRTAGLLLAAAGSVHLTLAVQSAVALPRTLQPAPAGASQPAAEEAPSCCHHKH
jgi:sulfite exporter TauE/SafE